MVPVPPTHRIRMTLIAALVLFFSSLEGSATDRFITVASTTSTRNSGLYDHILPLFTEATGEDQGRRRHRSSHPSGQGWRCRRPIQHHRPSEEAFVRKGFGVKRYVIMYNDFVIVGPKRTPPVRPNRMPPPLP